MLLESKLCLHKMWTCVLPCHAWNMVFLWRLDLVLCEFVYNTMSANCHENLLFDPFSFGGRIRKRCSMFAWTVISVVADIVRLHQGYIKATALLIFTCFFFFLLLFFFFFFFYMRGYWQQKKNAQWSNFKPKVLFWKEEWAHVNYLHI